MSLEENMDKAKEVVQDYLWWHKSVGLSGLSKYSKVSKMKVNAIRYSDEDTLADTEITKLISGLEKVKAQCVKDIDNMVAKLCSLKNNA